MTRMPDPHVTAWAPEVSTRHEAPEHRSFENCKKSRNLHFDVHNPSRRTDSFLKLLQAMQSAIVVAPLLPIAILEVLNHFQFEKVLLQWIDLPCHELANQCVKCSSIREVRADVFLREKDVIHSDDLLPSLQLCSDLRRSRRGSGSDGCELLSGGYDLGHGPLYYGCGLLCNMHGSRQWHRSPKGSVFLLTFNCNSATARKSSRLSAPRNPSTHQVLSLSTTALSTGKLHEFWPLQSCDLP
mmetsp:Transcript_163427/g.524040  ORF Transcript_163427/g.524040 Transcript_163427/m.524040 type:complete len:241 (+) Transcript_163427:213-935(+)